jgi:c-di-GMP-binding flagellar brake protein YcgR
MDRRRSPRVEIELECTLSRRNGAPIEARTVDLGPGGMSVKSTRPLAEDELVAFAIPDRRCDGRARVLREQRYHVYALRFEEIAEAQREALQALASD